MAFDPNVNRRLGLFPQVGNSDECKSSRSTVQQELLPILVEDPKLNYLKVIKQPGLTGWIRRSNSSSITIRKSAKIVPIDSTSLKKSSTDSHIYTLVQEIMEREDKNHNHEDKNKY